MTLAHLTLPSREVEKTAAFLEQTLGYRRDDVPDNIWCETVWLNVGQGQQLHIVFVDGFTVSPFEGEFGRHLAVGVPSTAFVALRERLAREGGDIVEPLRPAPFARFFVREPVNGYVFEVISEAPRASHFDQ